MWLSSRLLALAAGSRLTVVALMAAGGPVLVRGGLLIWPDEIVIRTDVVRMTLRQQRTERLFALGAWLQRHWTGMTQTTVIGSARPSTLHRAAPAQATATSGASAITGDVITLDWFSPHGRCRQAGRAARPLARPDHHQGYGSSNLPLAEVYAARVDPHRHQRRLQGGRHRRATLRDRLSGVERGRRGPHQPSRRHCRPFRD